MLLLLLVLQWETQTFGPQDPYQGIPITSISITASTGFSIAIIVAPSLGTAPRLGLGKPISPKALPTLGKRGLHLAHYLSF